MITSKYTTDPIYVLAKEAQQSLRRVLSPSTHSSVIHSFEDTMNGLSGEIQNLERSLQDEVKLENTALINDAAGMQITISLHSSVLSNTVTDTTTITTQIGKRLFPRTETVTIESSIANTPVSNTTAPVVLGYVDSEIESAEVVDEVFDEIDAEEVIEEPLATEQNETLPYLPSGMVTIAKRAAANANGLQAGLVEFSHNPLATIIANARSTLIYYTAGNYANLNTALYGVSSNASLTTQYKALRDAIGGPDGLSGCVSQLDNFKDHTDRLSGLVLDVDSPNAEPTDDSTTEDINLYDFSGGPTLIFSFDARKFRSAKYLVQATAIASDRCHQASDMYILHDGHHAYTREVAAIYTQDPFISFTTRLISGNVEVLATSNIANVDFVIHGTRLQIARASKSYAEMSQSKIIENHELLSVYLDDGVDYVQQQSESLLKPALVANLMREFNDMIETLRSSSFNALSLGSKQSLILSLAATLETRRGEIQASIESDYTNFINARKLAESLDIAFKLTQAYTDSSGNAIPSVTLNSATITAIGTE